MVKNKNNVDSDELRRLIVEECDHARDVSQLVEQLAPLLPIKSFRDLLELKTVKFRSKTFSTAMFEAIIPSIVFPIENVAALVRGVNMVVQATPDFMGVDPDEPKFTARMLRKRALPGSQVSGLPGGMPMGIGASLSQAGRIEPLGQTNQAVEG